MGKCFLSQREGLYHKAAPLFMGMYTSPKHFTRGHYESLRVVVGVVFLPQVNGVRCLEPQHPIREEQPWRTV